MPVAQDLFELLRKLTKVNRPRSTAHLNELQALFSLVTGKKRIISLLKIDTLEK